MPLDKVVHPRDEPTAMQSYHRIVEWSAGEDAYMVMPGGVTDEAGLLPQETIRAVLMSIGEALKKLHKRGIAHGLVTPEHILVHNNDSSVIKLAGLLNRHTWARSNVALSGSSPGAGHATIDSGSGAADGFKKDHSDE